MPRLSESSRKDRETRLLRAARQCFGELGYEATSIAGIARAAGVSDGLLYRYFSDKRALLLAVLALFFEDLIVRTADAVAQANGFPGRLRALTATHLQTMVDEPELCRLFLRQTRDSGNYIGSPIHAMTGRYTALLGGIVRAARAAGECRADIDVRLFRDLAFGGMEHIGWRFLGGDTRHDPRAAADQLVDLLLAGAAR
ncbi:MAG: TetR/AcrR family transcriptional regulator [Polymorphobacter sp.]